MPANAYTPHPNTGAPVSVPSQTDRDASEAERAASATVMRAFANRAPVSAPAVTPPPPAAIDASSLKSAGPEEGLAQEGALYTLEAAARCPECQNEIRTLRVLRVLRTQVSFTSTLPRKGYVVVCPQCERMLSASLSGLV
jgi:hypothetical protein